jgi:hypothetical protein
VKDGNLLEPGCAARSSEGNAEVRGMEAVAEAIKASSDFISTSFGAKHPTGYARDIGWAWPQAAKSANFAEEYRSAVGFEAWWRSEEVVRWPAISF